MSLLLVFAVTTYIFYTMHLFIRSWSKLISLGYHHRGVASLSLSWGMPLTEPQQGVPEMARRMMPILRNMVSAYKVGCRWSVGAKGC